MGKVIISDGIALIKLSPLQRYLTQRRHIAFELERLNTLYLEKTPTRRGLGRRKSPNFLGLFKTGEYLLGVKRVIFVGPSRGRCLKIMLLNPAFDEVYLNISHPEKLFVELSKYAKISSISTH